MFILIAIIVHLVFVTRGPSDTLTSTGIGSFSSSIMEGPRFTYLEITYFVVECIDTMILSRAVFFFKYPRRSLDTRSIKLAQKKCRLENSEGRFM